MTEPTFKDIFNIIIKPIIDEIVTDMDDDFKNATSFRMSDLDSLYQKCEPLYQYKREELKKLFYGAGYKGKPLSKDPHYLDLHKIGSIVCYCFVKCKVFWFDENRAWNYINEKFCDEVPTDWYVSNVLINYKLAFHASLAIIYYKILFDANENNDSELYELVESRQGLNLYPVKSDHESFENSIIIDMAKRNVNQRSFDCLLYAAVLFQLEEYNLQLFSRVLGRIK